MKDYELISIPICSALHPNAIPPPPPSSTSPSSPPLPPPPIPPYPPPFSPRHKSESQLNTKAAHRKKRSTGKNNKKIYLKFVINIANCRKVWGHFAFCKSETYLVEGKFYIQYLQWRHFKNFTFPLYSFHAIQIYSEPKSFKILDE